MFYNCILEKEMRDELNTVSLRPSSLYARRHIIMCLKHQSSENWCSLQVCVGKWAHVNSFQNASSSGGGGVGSGASPDQQDHRFRPLQPTNKPTHFIDRQNVL